MKLPQYEKHMHEIIALTVRYLNSRVGKLNAIHQGLLGVNSSIKQDEWFGYYRYLTIWFGYYRSHNFQDHLLQYIAFKVSNNF